jgi:hypothetical protein
LIKSIFLNIIYINKYEINTIFIDFDKIISDKVYLYNKLSSVLNEKNISFDIFSIVYDEINLQQNKLY